jgi:hypothetical protein
MSARADCCPAGWAGGHRSCCEGKNGTLRASSGVKLRAPLPVVRQPLRFYYAINPLRLAERFLLSDGSVFRPSERWRRFGWATGARF